MEAALHEGDSVPYSACAGDFIDLREETRWECVMCGKCCGNVFSRTWLDVELTQYIGDPVNGFCRHHDPKDHVCHIHPGRPNICRGYPFVLKKEGDSFKIQVHTRCSGLGAGKTIDPYEKGVELVKLMEDEFDMDFIIRSDGNGGVRLFRIK
ncbi:MAG: YkgJ family cysteine cluster protein [Candidatus Thermoplasmatota archaeon]|nr:YkgJ family cysteine cluster protein [Candidatus Thermoplasmatota archaeon]